MSTPMPHPDGDWATRAADSIEAIVTTVRDRTTRPLLIAGRGLVYGLFAAILAIAVIVLFSIALIRGLTVATGKAWIAEFIVGGLFIIIGIVLLVLRRTPQTETP
jgi:nitrate reductase gamma subunit